MSKKIVIEGVNFRNPVIIASCPLTESAKNVQICVDRGAGGVILKTAANYIRKEEAEPRKFLHGKDGYWAQSSFEREIMTIAEAEGIMQQLCRMTAVPVIASIAAKSLQIEEWVEAGKRMERAGASMLQLDFFYLEQLWREDGAEKKLSDVIGALKRECSIPIIPKININLPAPVIFPILVKAGIKTVSLLDSVRVPVVLEWAATKREASTKITNEGTSYFGGWQLPLSLGYLMEARKYGLSVIGGGGIRNVQDAEIMLQNGAEAIQIASVAMFGNYDVIQKYVEALKENYER